MMILTPKKRLAMSMMSFLVAAGMLFSLGASDASAAYPANAGCHAYTQYSVVIINDTCTYVRYNIDGRNTALSDHTQIVWNGASYCGCTSITFDNGCNRLVSYSLCSGFYEFRWVNGVLDLYRL